MLTTGRKVWRLFITGALLAFLGIVVGIGINYTSMIMAANWQQLSENFHLQDLGKDMLIKGIPGLAQLEKKETENIAGPGEVLQQAMGSISRGSFRDPKIFLTSQLSYLQLMGVEQIGPPSEEEIIFFERDYTFDEILPPEQAPKDNEPPPLVVTGVPLVAIYNSHNGETYIPDAGKARVDGSNGGVVTVAEMLANALEKNHGIPTVRSEKIHDYPSYAASYTNSLKTIEAILAQHPSVEIVIDVHRDHLPTRAQTTAEINGKRVARILFIVGNDERHIHPRWRQNLAFANGLEKIMEDMYPGLSRGVRQQAGRYNQHVHPRSILVEMGSSENSLQEAINSAELLADVLASMLLDIQQQKGSM